MARRLIQRAFPVRSGEGRLTLVLLLHSFCAVGAFVAARSVRDALYLAHADRASLPWMYVASAAAVALVGLAYNPIAARVRRDSITIWSGLLFAAAFLVLWRLEATHRPWVYPALYVYVEVMGALVILQFWTLCNEVFNAREAKRLYGLIGAGGTASNVFVGMATSRVALTLGAPALLPMCAVLLVGAAVAGYLAGKAGKERLFARAASGSSGPSRRGGLTRVLESPHLRSIAVMALLTFFTTTLVDFEFKVIASDAYPRNELAAYFGRFYAAVGVLALALQLFGTGRILSRFGVIGSLAVLPASLVLGNAAVVAFRTLWAAALSKGADTLFRYSVNDATSQILYLPIAPRARAAAKAFIDGVVKQVSIGLGGLALLGYRRFLGGDPYQLAWFALVLLAGWIAAVLSARRHYIRSLEDTLQSKRVDLTSVRYRTQDGSAAPVLKRALESADGREILGALELLSQMEGVELDGEVERLLEHPQLEVRIAALQHYGKRQALRFADSVFRRFDDPAPRARAAAIEVFCNLGRDKAIQSVRPYLQDPEPSVRAAAVTGIIRYGGLDGVLAASEALKALIGDPDARMREHAAKILGDIGVRNFYQPVLELMNDADPRVRRQAVAAAARLRSQEFILPLLYRTADCAHEAVEALSAYGVAVIPTLRNVLSSRAEDPTLRRGAARVLGRLATPEAVGAIAAHLDDPDEELRIRLYRSLARTLRTQRSLSVDRSRVTSALEQELSRAARTLAQAEALGLSPTPVRRPPRHGPDASAALLASALLEKVARAEERVFLLLAVLYPDAGMERIHAGIRDAAAQDAPRRRSNAVELLDNLLDAGLRKRVLPLVEDCPRADKLSMLAAVTQVQRPSRAAALQELCRDEAAWVRACAVYHATESASAQSIDALISGLTDPSPVVREIALVGCARAAPDRADTLLRPRLDDDADFVRRRAALLTGGRASA